MEEEPRKSQKGTPWLKVLKTLVAYRLLAPGSEWNLHRSWFDRSAMADLLDDDFRLAAIDTLYRRHDHLLDHRQALFTHLNGDLGLRPAFHQLDGRELRMKRYTKPEKVHHLLPNQLGFILPEHPRPKSKIPSLWWRPFEKMNVNPAIWPLKTT